jgi:hydrogenase expression/formation protein HypE
MSNTGRFDLACPIPISQYPRIVMAHGGGGRLMNQLIERMFLPVFGNQQPGNAHDSTTLQISGARLAFTTDSYVVHPLFFPGGDIGSLAVHGTVNDLAMSGARPLFLSAGFILEEGLPMETLWRVVQSMQAAASNCGVKVVTGDTKVVDKGKGDGVFINTAGIGLIEHSLDISPAEVREGDILLVSGDLGRHGMAIVTVREGMEFESEILSDSAPVSDLVLRLLDAGIRIRCLRDLTRGGLASALNEIAEAAGVTIAIEENLVPVRPDVRSFCEILGFDPLHLANEGRFVCFLHREDAERALELMKGHPMGGDSRIIGAVVAGDRPLVTLKSPIGVTRILDMLSGEQLPRIC